jgi:hypothetical protein
VSRHLRYRHDDPDPAKGIALVERTLGIALPRPIPELRYELVLTDFDDYYKYISLPAGDIAALIARFGYTAELDAEVRELVDGDIATFIAEHKRAFQPALADGDGVWFAPGSGVNHWELAYAHAGWLHVIVVDTG